MALRDRDSTTGHPVNDEPSTGLTLADHVVRDIGPGGKLSLRQPGLAAVKAQHRAENRKRRASPSESLADISSLLRVSSTIPHAWPSLCDIASRLAVARFRI
jgi:hypothetical protein